MDTQHTVFPQFESLQTLRDEIKVRGHLMKAEMQEKYEELDAQWQKLSANVKMLREAGRAAKEDVVAATEILLETLHKGYESISHRLNILH